MDSITQNKEDQMPVVLMVIRMLDKDFGIWAMKIGLQEVCKDLDGFLDELVAMRAKFKYWMEWYIDTAAINMEAVLDNKRIMDMARLFYWNLVFDYDIDNDDQLDFDLLLFLDSAAFIISCLCRQVISRDIELKYNLKTAQDLFDFAGLQDLEKDELNMMGNLYWEASKLKEKMSSL